MTVFVNVGVDELDELLKAFSQPVGRSARVVVAIENAGLGDSRFGDTAGV